MSNVTSHLQTAGNCTPRYTVTTAPAGGTQRLVATGPGAVTVVCSGSHVISVRQVVINLPSFCCLFHFSTSQGNPTLVRRGVTLTTGQGGSLAGGVCFTTATQAASGGITVLATGGGRPGSVVYQSGASGGPSTSAAQTTGITLLPTGAGGMAQIIRPRQPVRIICFLRFRDFRVSNTNSVGSIYSFVGQQVFHHKNSSAHCRPRQEWLALRGQLLVYKVQHTTRGRNPLFLDNWVRLYSSHEEFHNSYGVGYNPNFWATVTNNESCRIPSSSRAFIQRLRALQAQVARAFDVLHPNRTPLPFGTKPNHHNNLIRRPNEQLFQLPLSPSYISLCITFDSNALPLYMHVCTKLLSHNAADFWLVLWGFGAYLLGVFNDALRVVDWQSAGYDYMLPMRFHTRKGNIPISWLVVSFQKFNVTIVKSILFIH